MRLILPRLSHRAKQSRAKPAFLWRSWPPASRAVGALEAQARKSLTIVGVIVVALSISISGVFSAHTAAQEENPQDGSVGLEGTLPAPPPEQGATIVVPSNGQTVTDLPLSVGGLCPDGLLVKIFANEVFVGSVICEDGSYELEVSIFGGQNELVARVFDDLNQEGPESNRVNVTFDDAQFSQFGTSPITLTSDFARRGADPGNQLAWPFILSGGRGPYAVSVDPGDGSSSKLMSVPSPGVFEVQHTYETAGVYRMTVSVTDANDQSAFLQVVAVANGQPTESDEAVSARTQSDVIWWPAAISVTFIFAAFWLGRRYQVQELRNKFKQYATNDKTEETKTSDSKTGSEK